MSTDEKARISFAISHALLDRVYSNMRKNNYNKRAKSKWICEALTQFFNIANAIEIVDLGGDAVGKPGEKGKIEVFTIPIELKRALYDFQIKVKEKHAALGSIQSRIIRAAIRQKLLRKS